MHNSSKFISVDWEGISTSWGDRISACLITECGWFWSRDDCRTASCIEGNVANNVLCCTVCSELSWSVAMRLMSSLWRRSTTSLACRHFGAMHSPKSASLADVLISPHGRTFFDSSKFSSFKSCWRAHYNHDGYMQCMHAYIHYTGFAWVVQTRRWFLDETYPQAFFQSLISFLHTHWPCVWQAQAGCGCDVWLLRYPSSMTRLQSPAQNPLMDTSTYVFNFIILKAWNRMENYRVVYISYELLICAVSNDNE